jgi:hypothetical protein
MAKLRYSSCEYWDARKELKELLNKPLPGGRTFQEAHEKRIHYLCKLIGEVNY